MLLLSARRDSSEDISSTEFSLTWPIITPNKHCSDHTVTDMVTTTITVTVTVIQRITVTVTLKLTTIIATKQTLTVTKVTTD